MAELSLDLALLTTEEMARADQLAARAGVPEATLMENAGRAVADEAARMVSGGAHIAVLCGPGNNGGDGFVAARLLAERGYRVRVAMLGSVADMKGAAAQMAKRWMGEIHPLRLQSVSDCALIVDAIFGAGLNRPVPAEVGMLLSAAARMSIPVLAVDVPTGLDGTTGETKSLSYQATRTVTFVRRKPGHLLLPGRDLCGPVTVADIGIPAEALAEIRSETYANAPGLWLERYPWPWSQSHKFARGHTVVVSGPPQCTGAARLAARGALRAGAGVVTLASPVNAFVINAAHLTAIMLKPFAEPEGLAAIIAGLNLEYDTVVIGPGLGRTLQARASVLAVLRKARKVVLDADALSAFAETRGTMPAAQQDLFSAIAKAKGPIILTPHEGEFARLFPALQGSKLDRARQAASQTGTTVVLKGADTVIAAPDGRAAINENAPPWLATAGSGDVLAGFIAGLLAQGMPAFESACAGVWLHGEVAVGFGPGLIAEDLPEHLPKVLSALLARQKGPA
jgi:ADP-dependent NAD(P)H-hydrate dehydratase / NAD(P)H-hydrate epimerase